ncbi:MAG: VWA domain-containing protein [Gammaproteobacteria bacterium]|nr:VWA domain-containing protein [Gammaproteobacteria bacterium]MDH3749139.1 VWA domain-containing protein [Gammaproteobacteria bacterium]MDH3804613.1 VWA domain-containing protein [Gammaproteobacteria bacterium]
MLADFHFLRPDWLWAVPVVIACALLLARRQLGPGSWQNVVDVSLAPHVLSRSVNRRSDFRWWLLGLGGVIAAVAIAGPAWQRVEQPVFRSDQALIVALDLSRSMDAQDVAPSRLIRARLKILDLLARRGSGQTALVVFSSNAFTVTPLTTDTDTIGALVNSLSTDIMPSRGSYPIAAINKGQQLLEQAGAAYGEVLLITDGSSSPATERVARELRGSGYTLSVFAVGTAEGAPIPRQSGGFVTDQSGNIAVPRLDEHSLRSLATAGGGRFSLLTTDNRDLDYLLSGEAGRQQAGEESLVTDHWREEGPWLILLLLPLAAMAFRRGWVAVFLIFILPPENSVHAASWNDLWLTRDQQGQRKLEEGVAADAVVLFENPEWRAVAQYRAQDYAASARAFAEQEDARSLYNLGNAMARQGEFESAIDAYEQVLEIDPGNADAEYNRDLLQQLQEQQESQQDQGDQQEPSDQQGEGEPSDESGESDQESSDSSAQSESESEGDSSQRDEQQANEEDLEALREELQQAAEEAAQNEQQMAQQQLTAEELEALRREQEQQQAMEQWLRRIPNDPGGLLRRKFRYQYQKSGKDQDGNNTWPDDEVQPW